MRKRAAPTREVALASAGLEQMVGLLQSGKETQIIAFLASRAGEGTSTIAREFAGRCAKAGQKVLLLDASAEARGGLLQPPAGLVDVIAVAALRVASHRSDQLKSKAERTPATQRGTDEELWLKLRATYDKTVIDLPSMERGSDQLAMAAIADGVVIVVEAEKTPAAAISATQAKLTWAGARVLGVVMNKRHFYIPNRIYRRL